MQSKVNQFVFVVVVLFMAYSVSNIFMQCSREKYEKMRKDYPAQEQQENPAAE